ncbi:MAG: AAA family ATPase, partial [Gemmatimonadota bacterium]
MPVPVTPPQRAFEFRCLGPVSLTRPDGERVRFRTRKQMALLLLLAMRQGRPWPREQLVELLWSGDDELSARHSLSQSVSLINKNLGAEAITGASKDQVVLREGLIRLDVAAFEERVSAKRFTEARDLWHGNLLEGLWIQRAPHFDRWLDEERQRLARDMRRVLRALIEAQRAEGDWEAMRATAEAILDLDALDEAAMLAYLESLSLDGDRTLALRRYREFEARLKDELDAEPGAALRSWLKRHRKGDGAPAEDSATRRAPAGRVSETIVLPTALPVFGRHAEYAALWEAWEAARAGQGGFIILEGEPGIGKTALASKLVNQVHVAGGSACFVKCYRSEKSVPFAPISALIRQLSRLPGFVALSDTWIGELTRLVPELRERYPNAPQPMAVDDSARYRLCDAAMHAAECVADEHPLLVVVDDIQDADEATLALVHYFGRQ